MVAEEKECLPAGGGGGAGERSVVESLSSRRVKGSGVVA